MRSFHKLKDMVSSPEHHTSLSSLPLIVYVLCVLFGLVFQLQAQKGYRSQEGTKTLWTQTGHLKES